MNALCPCFFLIKNSYTNENRKEKKNLSIPVFVFYFSILFFVFGLHHEACGILIPLSGIEPEPLKWKRRVLITGPPGKSH